jgi:hypothetical protein
MESIIRDVTALDEPHRRALEDVLGRALRSNQRLVINVLEMEVPAGGAGERPRQTLADWTKVYEGLTAEEVEQIDMIAKDRADLSRHLP